MSKHLYKIKYNKIENYNEQNKKSSNIKKVLSKTLHINNMNLNKVNNNLEKNSNKKKIVKNNSYRAISESEIKEKNSHINDDKLTIKTTLLKSKEKQNTRIDNNDPNKYHINFELLANARINNNINIHMTFI